MSKKRKVVKGIESSVRKELTRFEAKQLEEIIEAVEWYEYKESGMSMISGGFAHADMFNYDNEIVDIELKWGVQSDCQDNVNTEAYKIHRGVLNNKSLSIKEKMEAIY